MKTVSKKKQDKVSDRVVRKRARQRHEMISVAKKLLLDKGVEAVTLAAVAAELGLTKQAIYHYFKGKEGLLGSLTSSLLEEEVSAILAAVDKERDRRKIPGKIIEAFHAHYRDRLPQYRIIYCQTQLLPPGALDMDAQRLGAEVNPQTRNLFDVLEERLSQPGYRRAQRRVVRRLAFSAWLAGLGLISMLGVAEAVDDPLIYSDAELLDSLKKTFNGAVPD